MKRFLFSLLIIFVTKSFSQTVKVVDFDTRLPIENVMIYDESKKVVNHTNKEGIVSISEYQESDILSFSHIGYIELEILKKELQSINYEVLLHKKSQQ